MTSHKFNFILATQKISTFVLKGVSYIALWKFTKSQDGENFPSPRIVKNFQQQIYKKFQQQIFKKFQQQIFKKIQQQIFKNFQEHWTLLPAKVAKINSIPKWKTIYSWGNWKFSKYKNLTKSWSWWDVPKSSYFVKR